jgi:hypothetical protein
MQEITNRGATMCVSKAALAAGTTTTFSTTGATLYCIEGKAYSVAAKTNAATPTTDANTGEAFIPVTENQGSVFVFGYNAAGDTLVAQGDVKELDAGGQFTELPEFPPIPEDFCPFAYMGIKVADGGTTWTFGSSNQAGVSGVTYTRQDVMTLPRRPQSV